MSYWVKFGQNIQTLYLNLISCIQVGLLCAFYPYAIVYICSNKNKNNIVFSFVNQKSTYLSDPGNAKKVQQLVNKYIDEAKELRLQKEKQKPEEPPKQETATPQTNTTQTPSVKKEKEVSENNPKPGATTQEPEKAKENGEEKQKDEQKDEKRKVRLSNDPVNNGGVTDNYVWTQTLQDVDVRIPIPSNLKGKDLTVTFDKRKLFVGIKGKPPIINGQLHEAVSVDECAWTLDREHGKTDKTLTVSLRKETGMCWWKRVIIGDPEIDTSKIEPENSSLNDLDPETKQTVEKMMVEQRQKMMGIPTQKEIEQQQMIEKLKQKFPNMDFSQTKFS
ncbi:hypothetical protein RFI_00558 [Reticulomyxa filosa]|uniref:CS domain-containing protein n=1 Tax=Reticulomyxa filosa TaxID=46433 RepID=X6PEG9_RETFI|nr:hypothetical protein RFI_00558 [Reticulomyxa filosa]|eukprot:ETO36503.1 hypothetical protein RFI_00558 [Reticulomyxa filosa]